MSEAKFIKIMYGLKLKDSDPSKFTDAEHSENSEFLDNLKGNVTLSENETRFFIANIGKEVYLCDTNPEESAR